LIIDQSAKELISTQKSEKNGQNIYFDVVDSDHF